MKTRILIPRYRSLDVFRSSTFLVAITLALVSLASIHSFPIPTSIRHSQSLSDQATAVRSKRFHRLGPLNAAKKSISEEELKQQLTEYLAKRKEANADEAAKEIKGKVVGGTRGNAVLEFVSGAPVKEQVIDRAPDVFDYDELSRYGYSNLVAPIMDLVGGRRAVYDLMDMETPPLLGPPPKKKVPKLKIDRTGEEDQARYTGLKMGQVLDDDVMAEALARANKKAKEGKELRPTLMEENYVQPFAGKCNVYGRVCACAFVLVRLLSTACWKTHALLFVHGQNPSFLRRRRQTKHRTGANSRLDPRKTRRIRYTTGESPILGSTIQNGRVYEGSIRSVGFVDGGTILCHVYRSVRCICLRSRDPKILGGDPSDWYDRQCRRAPGRIASSRIGSGLGEFWIEYCVCCVFGSRTQSQCDIMGSEGLFRRPAHSFAAQRTRQPCYSRGTRGCQGQIATNERLIT